MGYLLNVEEERVLHGLINDAAGDIVLRLDLAGFIVHASENAEELGIDLSSLLLMPHISDFADTDHAPEVARHVARVFAGETGEGWIEFPVRNCMGHDGGNPSPSCSLQTCQRWYAFSLRLIEPDDGAPQGALGLLRSVQQKYALEGEINARALTDPFTGLANRHAFLASLRRSITQGSEQAVAVLAVDSLRAVFMQYGQHTADEIQWGFAKFLETMADSSGEGGFELAQLDGDRFAVLFADMTVTKARIWVHEVLQTFQGLTVTSTRRAPELTASAGLARVEVSVDWTMRQAELGLVMARAGGGMQIGLCNRPVRAVAGGTMAVGEMDEQVQRHA